MDTCATVRNGLHDPTYPITKYIAPNANLAEFNTAGKVSYTTSCGAWGTTPCILLTSASPPPPIKGQFTFPPGGTLTIVHATIIPQTLAMRYQRVAGITSNNTFFFDVSGNQAQTGSFSITTTATVTVTFFGPAPSPVTCSCSQSYTNGEEILVFGPNTTNSVFTLVWPTGQNANVLFAMAESLSPIGDLSAIVSKELEFSAYMSPQSGTATTCANAPNANCEFGFFLTTNATLWQTNNVNFNPYTSPDVALFDEFWYTGGGPTVNNNLYIQTHPGETLQQEDSGCSSGSPYLCSSHLQGVGAGIIGHVNLNYTGGSAGAQVGSGVNCPNGINQPGGPGCSYTVFTTCAIGPLTCNTETITGTAIFPKLPISGVTYYVGFWLGSTELAAPIVFCFDLGANCAAQQTPITNGCVTASLEFDSCVPNPTSNNGVNSVTDSGGFFGAAWRSMTSVTSWFGGITKPLWGPVLTTLSNAGGTFIADFVAGLQAFAAMEVQIWGGMMILIQPQVVGFLNTFGNFIGLGNVGTDLQSLISAVVVFFTSGQFGNIFGNLPSVIGRLVDALGVFFPWLPKAIKVGSDIATFGLNSIGFGLTIWGFIIQLVSGAFATYLIVFFFIYTGDDSIAGVLSFFETTVWLVFGLGLKFVAHLVNFALDLITAIIGVIPKPFIQMVAHALPRIPIVEINARMVMPSGSMSEIRNGNMFAASLWLTGILFLDMYETASPALPGSIAFLLPSLATGCFGPGPVYAPVNCLAPLAGFIPLLEIATAFLWGASFLIIPIQWLSNAFDFGEIPFTAALGEKKTLGFGGISIRKGTKHFQGRLERKIGARAELRQLQRLKGEERKERDEAIRQRELREVHGKDIEGPRL